MAAKNRARPAAPVAPEIRTTADLARQAGLSRATVSRILNGHAGIKQKNIDRVMQLVERSGFAPNPYSNILRGRRSGIVAVCISSFRFPSVTQRLACVVRTLQAAGFTPLIESSETSDNVAIQKWIRRMRAEAVIFVGQHHGHGLASHLQDLAVAGIPHVFTDDTGEAGANTVAVDRARGMELLADHLLDLGHTGIGLLGIDGDMPVAVARLRGLRRAVSRRKLDPERVIVALESPPPLPRNMTFGREAARRLAGIPRSPTAFVALNDDIAFGAMEGFRSAGLAVPAAVSVAGFDNSEISRVAVPSITTIDPQTEPTALAAVDLLLQQLKSGTLVRGRMQLLPPELIVRDSTGPAARAGAQ